MPTACGYTELMGDAFLLIKWTFICASYRLDAA